MLRGDFAQAWSISDRVLRERLAREESCLHWPRHLQFIWRGTSLRNRRVLVRCYHGLGDTIQFIRLLAQLHDHARHTIVWAQPALLELLQSASGIDVILPLHDGAPGCAYDVDIELMELLHYFRLTTQTIPKRVPYLLESLPRRRLEPLDALHVGLAWNSGTWNPDRSLDPDAGALLRSVCGVRWYSLQYQSPDPPVPAVSLVDADIAITAKRMLALDLVLSVDTYTAHLAGALALPVWTLLPYDCDWRWMSNGECSPWYPTMRLFRQPRPGDWPSVVRTVCHLLAGGWTPEAEPRHSRAQVAPPA